MISTAVKSRVHIASGLVLAVFIASHFTNHALGIVSIEVMERGRASFSLLWRSLPGTLLLYSALLVHVLLALDALRRRNTLRMPLAEALKIGFGLSLPLLIADHVIATRLDYTLTGFVRGYPEVLRAIGVSSGMIALYTVALVIVWAHGCLGLWFWLRGRGWFQRFAPVFHMLAVVLPILALTGIFSGLRWVEAVPATANTVKGLPVATIYGIADIFRGCFLLLVAGDGIAEGTRRIGEYLRDQPGLAFGFGLIEIAEYRYVDEAGEDRTIVQPRVLAQTAVIERHVIRSEVPGLVIETVAEPSPGQGERVMSDAGLQWRSFVERFVSEVRFDDPGQPAPRSGGMGWMKLPLPDGYYINLYRSQGENRIGAQVRFPGSEGQGAFADLATDREAIEREFADAGLSPPEWQDGEVPSLIVTTPSALPWTEEREAEQRAWFAMVGNQFVNSLRPRLQRLTASAT